MGSIVGGLAGIAGGVMGGEAATQYANQASQAALTGYNYLQNNPYAQQYIQSGAGALSGMTGALGNEAGVQSQIAGLLGVGGNAAQSQAAFNNYKNSTGYNFQLNQGNHAINASQAASGMLDSGATGKALEAYGQNLASTTFNNYLGQLGGLNSAYGGLASGYGSQAGLGENMLNSIGQAGTTGGANSANALLQAGQAQSNMWGGLGGAVGNMFSGLGVMSPFTGQSASSIGIGAGGGGGGLFGF